MNSLREFLKDEDAAVTVDWVVLTASIVMLGLVVIATVESSIIGHGNSVETHLRNQSVGVPGGG